MFRAIGYNHLYYEDREQEMEKRISLWSEEYQSESNYRLCYVTGRGDHFFSLINLVNVACDRSVHLSKRAPLTQACMKIISYNAEGLNFYL